MAKAENKGERKGAFRLEVPLDASGIEGFKPDQRVKVVAADRKGATRSETIDLDRQGKGTATFTFPEHPGPLRVAVGPANAADDDLLHLQTIAFNVETRQWRGSRELRIPPIPIPPYYWWWWFIWCRDYTINGRVVCADGSPVPGAKVCAFDVDWWWWWISEEQVGCATTDATGAFQITFRRCCGWWPWWWWRQRFWRLEPVLVERILPVLGGDPGLAKILPQPTPRPDIGIFEQLLSGGPAAARQMRAVDPAALPALRERLLRRLPAAAELEKLRLWPWWPWFPWWDCDADIVFRATQDCVTQGTVIVQEAIPWDVRWNIPTTLSVTLVANDQACCIPQGPTPEGDCMVISRVCDDLVSSIGGNPGAVAATPAGYRDPGSFAPGSYGGDRPYAGVVPISGLFGDAAQVDYYEFEWSTDGGVTWNPMPPAAAGGFVRYFWGPALPAGPVGPHPVSFAFTNAVVPGRNVIESREHFEANNGAGTWGITRFWMSNWDLLMNWLTTNTFADETYQLRVKSWKLQGPNWVFEVLPLCDTKNDNNLVVTLDDQVVVPPLAHPHPCGTGTVHTCTTEPDTAFLAVTIGGVPVGACANVTAKKGTPVVIDFLASDSDDHLAYYTLHSNYGDNLSIDLLGLLGTPGVTLTSLGAAQVGPTYGDARTPAQGAAAPAWAGGAIRLTIPDVCLAFPQTCCYQLELRAHKRTIVDCDDSYWPHSNLSQLSFGVVVECG